MKRTYCLKTQIHLANFLHKSVLEHLKRRELLYLFNTRLPMLKEDSEATVVMGMLRTSHAMDESSLNLIALFLQ